VAQGNRAPDGDPDAQDSFVGSRLGGFDIIEKLGQGGMGAVYKARHVDLGRLVALKILPEDFVRAGGERVERFRREARLAAQLFHPTIVTVFSIGQARSLHYIEMEFVDGESADQYVRRHGGRVPWQEAVRVARDVAKALSIAHESGIIHRDIKPANVMLTRAGQVKVADFGLSKGTEEQDQDAMLTRPGQVLGTPYYMSVEQAVGEPVDQTTDLYALGGTLYFLLTGNPPFPGDSRYAVLYKHKTAAPPDPQQVVPDVPARCAEIIRKAMAKKPAARYQSAAEMIADLDALTADEHGVPRMPTMEASAVQAGAAPAAVSQDVSRGYVPTEERASLPATSAAAPTPGPSRLQETFGDGAGASEELTGSAAGPVRRHGVLRVAGLIVLVLIVASVVVAAAAGDRVRPILSRCLDWARTAASITALNTTDMAAVEGGAFQMGVDAAAVRPLLERWHLPAGWLDAASPPRDVALRGFYMDRFEVTNAQYAQFLAALQAEPDARARFCHSGEARLLPNKDRTPAVPAWAAEEMAGASWEEYARKYPRVPVTGVDWFDAYAYARWSGKRLPTEAEWERAARGTDGRLWPWGNEWRIEHCAVSPFGPSEIGSHEAGASPSGCHDMAGNVWEWTATRCASVAAQEEEASRASATPPAGPEPANARPGTERVIRGGGWRRTEADLGMSVMRASRAPAFRSDEVGFRCAADRP